MCNDCNVRMALVGIFVSEVQDSTDVIIQLIYVSGNKMKIRAETKIDVSEWFNNGFQTIGKSSDTVKRMKFG